MESTLQVPSKGLSRSVTVFRDRRSVIDIRAESDSESRSHDHLLEIANQASSHRDERLALNAKRRLSRGEDAERTCPTRIP